MYDAYIMFWKEQVCKEKIKWKQRAKNSSASSYNDCNFIMSPNSNQRNTSWFLQAHGTVSGLKKKKMEGKGEIIFSFSHDLKPCTMFILFR